MQWLLGLGGRGRRPGDPGSRLPVRRGQGTRQGCRLTMEARQMSHGVRERQQPGQTAPRLVRGQWGLLGYAGHRAPGAPLRPEHLFLLLQPQATHLPMPLSPAPTSPSPPSPHPCAQAQYASSSRNTDLNSNVHFGSPRSSLEVWHIVGAQCL